MSADVVSIDTARAYATADRREPDAEIRLRLYYGEVEGRVQYVIDGGHDEDVLSWDDALREAAGCIADHRGRPA